MAPWTAGAKLKDHQFLSFKTVHTCAKHWFQFLLPTSLSLSFTSFDFIWRAAIYSLYSEHQGVDHATEPRPQTLTSGRPGHRAAQLHSHAVLRFCLVAALITRRENPLPSSPTATLLTPVFWTATPTGWTGISLWLWFPWHLGNTRHLPHIYWRFYFRFGELWIFLFPCFSLGLAAFVVGFWSLWYILIIHPLTYNLLANTCSHSVATLLCSSSLWTWHSLNV